MDNSERNPNEAIQQVATHAAMPLHMLLAEDTQSNQRLVSYVLQRRGHTLDIASNGEQALQQIEKQDYDVILMDVQMPVMDGFQATAAIRALEDRRKAGVPIVAMTAHAMNGDEQRCLAAGMNAYISKPVNAQELIEMVEKIGRGEKPRANQLPGDSPAPLASQSSVETELAECFQLELAVKKCFGKYRMFQEMVRCLYAETDDLVGQLHAAIDGNDADKVYRTAHRLKNTVVYLAANSATAATAEIEQAGMAGDLPRARAALGRLVPEIERLKTALAPHRPADDADPKA